MKGREGGNPQRLNFLPTDQKFPDLPGGFLVSLPPLFTQFHLPPALLPTHTPMATKRKAEPTENTVTSPKTAKVTTSRVQKCVHQLAQQFCDMKAKHQVAPVIDTDWSQFTRDELEAYFQHDCLAEDNAELRAQLQDPELKQFHGRDLVPNVAPFFTLTGPRATEHFGDKKLPTDNLWAYLERRTGFPWRCSDHYMQVLLEGLIEDTTGLRPGIALARLVLWERTLVNTEQLLCFANIQQILAPLWARWILDVKSPWTGWKGNHLACQMYYFALELPQQRPRTSWTVTLNCMIDTEVFCDRKYKDDEVISLDNVKWALLTQKYLEDVQ